ncbi:hypothetical protein PFISCL1PPCAC_477 [Pristionchus fissidentatus]|uniref:Uncharacterized protein n=1 Tax=Pristionchus fissidentatus TaxID=1538716 RepID=A0AAV5UUD8_9BILA|nr:hypothetical protein PFISCL1PPCAC_477 [Pristionchus fissidentatus]
MVYITPRSLHEMPACMEEHLDYARTSESDCHSIIRRRSGGGMKIPTAMSARNEDASVSRRTSVLLSEDLLKRLTRGLSIW